MKDGSRQQFSGEQFSYLGHTPGAELVDSAISPEQRVMVTVAKLKNAKRGYLPDPEATWEFCLWDIDTQEMLRRWTRNDVVLTGDKEANLVEPRVSLLDQGKKMLFASDSQTHILDLRSGNDVLKRDDFGTYFAVENPNDKSQVLLVKRSGSIRLLDLDSLQSWENTRIDDVTLRTSTDTAMNAVWSRAANQVYLIFASGNVLKVALDNGKAEVIWNAYSAKDSSKQLASAMTLIGGKVRSHADMDAELASDVDGESLHLAIRSGSNTRQTQHISLDFATNGESLRAFDSSKLEGNRWLKRSDEGSLALVADLHEELYVDTKRVRSLHQLGKETFVSSRTSQSYAISEGSQRVISFGRTPVVSASGDQSGRVLYSLHSDGTLNRFELLEDGQPKWTKLELDTNGISTIHTSADGGKLALLKNDSAQIYDVASKQLLKEFNAVAALAWNPTESAELAVSNPEGEVVIYDSLLAEVQRLQVRKDANETVVGIHFFRETWANSEKAARRHILAHLRASGKDVVTLVSRDPVETAAKLGATDLEDSDGSASIELAADGVIDAVSDPDSRLAEELPVNSVLTVSPTEGIFASGTTSGTVSIWYCNPTFGAPRQLFDLEGHRGASITALKFTADGKSLVSADNKDRFTPGFLKTPWRVSNRWPLIHRAGCWREAAPRYSSCTSRSTGLDIQSHRSCHRSTVVEHWSVHVVGLSRVTIMHIYLILILLLQPKIKLMDDSDEFAVQC